MMLIIDRYMLPAVYTFWKWCWNSSPTP